MKLRRLNDSRKNWCEKNPPGWATFVTFLKFNCCYIVIQVVSKSSFIDEFVSQLNHLQNYVGSLVPNYCNYHRKTSIFERTNRVFSKVITPFASTKLLYSYLAHVPKYSNTWFARALNRPIRNDPEKAEAI